MDNLKAFGKITHLMPQKVHQHLGSDQRKVHSSHSPTLKLAEERGHRSKSTKSKDLVISPSVKTPEPDSNKASPELKSPHEEHGEALEFEGTIAPPSLLESEGTKDAIKAAKKLSKITEKHESANSTHDSM